MTKTVQKHKKANHTTKVNKTALRMEKNESEMVENPAKTKAQTQVKATAIKYLTDLKNSLLVKLGEAEEATSLYKKSTIIKQAKAEYANKMEKLTSVYNLHQVDTIPEVEKLKEELRALYKEKIQDTGDELARQYEKQINDEIASPAHQAILKETQIENDYTVAIMEQIQESVVEMLKQERELECANEALIEALKLQEEEQLEKQIEKNQVTLDRIDGILIRLGDKINGIGEHSEDALIQAVALHETLTNARNELAIELEAGENGLEATRVFKETCAMAINSVKSTLETDLGWGEYLKNMLKSIANVFITGAQALGSSITFFNTSSKSSQAIAETGQELQSDEENTLSI